jgi:hypothetical protein
MTVLPIYIEGYEFLDEYEGAYAHDALKNNCALALDGGTSYVLCLRNEHLYRVYSLSTTFKEIRMRTEPSLAIRLRIKREILNAMESED